MCFGELEINSIMEEKFSIYHVLGFSSLLACLVKIKVEL